MLWNRLLLLFVFAAQAAALDPNAGIVSHIRRHPVHSSALAAIGYSRHLHALEIQFLSGGTYRYLDVPIDVYRDFIAAESKTRFYNGNIRGRYRSLHVRSAAE